MALHRPALVVLAASAVAAGTMSAQSVHGTVRDAGTGVPLANVEIIVYATTGGPARALSSANGTFSLTVPRRGAYHLDARRIGYVPIMGRALDVQRDTTIALALDVVALRLDTVYTRDTEDKPKLTPGREMVRRHLLLGKGLIVSGWEIERSGMLLSEYLAKLDGMKLIGVAPPATPAIPAKNGFIVGTSRPNPTCVYARVNHASLFSMLMQQSRGTIDDLLLLREIMAVEIYRSRQEVPKEWRAEMIVQDLFVRDNGGASYVIGHSGAVIDWLSLDQDVEFLTQRVFTIRDTTLLRRPPGAPRPTRVLARPPRMHSIPDCAFMQIWTRLAWD
jgi:hypothetical protein